jgi:hypothetical protein
MDCTHSKLAVLGLSGAGVTLAIHAWRLRDDPRGGSTEAVPVPKFRADGAASDAGQMMQHLMQHLMRGLKVRLRPPTPTHGRPRIAAWGPESSFQAAILRSAQFAAAGELIRPALNYEAGLGLGRIVALYCSSSTSCQIHEHIR